MKSRENKSDMASYQRFIVIARLGTRAVSVATIGTLGVLGTGVPTFAIIWAFLWVNTFIVDVVEHQAVRAAKLFGSGGELTHDVFSAGGWVGEGGMGQGNAVGTNCLTLGALETFNVFLDQSLLTLSGK